MKQIGVQNVKLSEYEMSIAAHLVDPLSMQVRMLLGFSFKHMYLFQRLWHNVWIMSPK